MHAIAIGGGCCPLITTWYLSIYGIGFNTPSSASTLMLGGFEKISLQVSIQLDKNWPKVTERSHCLQSPLCTQTQHESPNVSGVSVWALCAHTEPLGCRTIAFYRFWAIILPTFGGLGNPLGLQPDKNIQTSSIALANLSLRVQETP